MNGMKNKLWLIWCMLFGHKYFLIRNLTSWSRKIGCHRCNKRFAMNDDVRVVLGWDEDFEKLYKDMGINTSETMA